MRVLVTGAGGFLGGRIASKLVDKEYKVRSLARNAYPLLDKMGIESFQGDLKNPGVVADACQGCDVVFHVAAKAGVWGSYEDYYNANVVGTENVINGCLKHGVKKLIYTSSPSVVFDGCDQEGIGEDTPYPEKFLNFYQKTKSIAEKKVLAANSNELATVALRPHLIWGPGDNHLTPRILDMAKKGRLRFIGKANKKIDAVYIDNAADAHILAMEKLSIGSQASGNVYFVTNHEPWPIEDVVNGILRAGGLSPNTRRLPFRLAYNVGALLEGIYSLFSLKGEPRITRFVAKQLSQAHWFDNGAIKRDIGYVPKISMDEGFKLLRRELERG